MGIWQHLLRPDGQQNKCNTLYSSHPQDLTQRKRAVVVPTLQISKVTPLFDGAKVSGASARVWGLAICECTVPTQIYVLESWREYVALWGCGLTCILRFLRCCDLSILRRSMSSAAPMRVQRRNLHNNGLRNLVHAVRIRQAWHRYKMSTNYDYLYCRCTLGYIKYMCHFCIYK